MVVGLHFLPLARVFRAPGLTVIGISGDAVVRSLRGAVSLECPRDLGLTRNGSLTLGGLRRRVVSRPQNRRMLGSSAEVDPREADQTRYALRYCGST